MTTTPRSVLFVHAHPDDETGSTGGTIARCVAEGVAVTVVTCTRGEQGKIAVPELAHCAADQDDTLGDVRSAELAAANSTLGVTDHRYLIAEGFYRDSGRMGLPSNNRPDAFWQADLDQAAIWLARVIRETRPGALVTYDPIGGYNHPDHIQAHRVAMRAVQLAQTTSLRVPGTPYEVPRVYWCAVPRRLIQAELDDLKARESELPGLWINTDAGEYPDGVHDDSEIAVQVDVSDYMDVKCAATACHRTQLSVRDGFSILASGRGNRIQDREWFIDAMAWQQGIRGTAWRDWLFDDNDSPTDN